MTLQQAPYYWITCDGLLDDGTTCGTKSTEGGDSSAWGDASTAYGDASCCDWVQHDGKDYCEEHSMQFRCDDCGEIHEECVCAADRADVAATP